MASSYGARQHAPRSAGAGVQPEMQPLFQPPPAGFHEPIELLHACHQRIRNTLEILERLHVHLAAGHSSEDAAVAAQRVLKYFREAAPRHHADEEDDLFPRLRVYCDHPDADPRLVDWLDALAAAHDHLEAGWERLDPALERVANGESAALPTPEDWIHAYRAHLEMEENVILPLAEHLLTPAERAAIGAAMAARRGLEPHRDD